MSESDNSTFIDMMERYFDQDTHKKLPDARPQFHYQVGVTPERIERPRNHCNRMKELGLIKTNNKNNDNDDNNDNNDNQSMSLCPPELDPKWRYFWRIGNTPSNTQFKQLNADAVIPSNFKDEW